MAHATFRRVRVSHQMALGLLVCTLAAVSTCILWSSTAAAIEAPRCAIGGGQESTVINFFVHDDFDVSPVGSAFTVVNPVSRPNGITNSNLFGSIAVLDDKITAGPEVNSTEIARGRGFYVFNHLQPDSTSLEFVLTAIFNNQSGFDDGSTLIFRGYDNINAVYRELAILGGTGTFRLARGWAGILTYQLIGGAAILNFTSYVYYGCNNGVAGANASGSSEMIPSVLTVWNILICILFLRYQRRLFQ